MFEPQFKYLFHNLTLFIFMNYHHKKLLLFIFSLICLSNWSYAQLPNPSFETLVSCPTYQGDVVMGKLSNWSLGCYTANNTPDILASCAPVVFPSTNQDISVPFNFLTRGLPNGLMPRHGNNYVHLKTGDAPESIKSNFITTLALGREYRVRIWAALTAPQGVSVNTPFNTNSGVEIRLLNTAVGANNCTNTLTIPLNGTFTTRGQWTQFEATFRVSDLMLAAGLPIELDDPNNPYGVYFNFKQTFEIRAKRNGEGIFIDDMSLVETPCNLNPAYSYSIGCDKKANQAVINVIGNVVNQNSQWNLYQMTGNSVADQDIVGGPNNILQQLSGHQVQFRVPNIAGRYYMIKHGVWESNNGCGWVEQRRTFLIPTFNDYVNSDFSGTYNSPSGTGTPSIQVTASDPTNPISNWLLFSSSYDAPITPSLSGWNFVTSVGNTNTHTFNNLQNGTYYLVRHNSKHNCSQYGHTYKKFYGNIQRMANNTTFEAIDSNTGTMTEEEYKAFEKMMQQEAANIQNPVKLYPNPATSVVNITANTLASEYKVTITNQYGKQMYEGVLSKEISLNIATWRKGLYFVNVHTPDGIKVEKLLVE